MYLEFILLFLDYFKTLNRRIIIYEWIFPVIICFLLFSLNCKYDLSAYKLFKENSINILGVLLGFSIAIITIITTGGGKNLEEIKNIKTDFKKNNREITLYDLILINFTYSVILEILVIIGCLLIPLVSNLFKINHNIKLIIYSIMVFLVVHVLLVTMRNLTDFYLIITKNTRNIIGNKKKS